MSIYGAVFHGAVIAGVSCRAVGPGAVLRWGVNDGADGHLSASQRRSKPAGVEQKERER